MSESKTSSLYCSNIDIPSGGVGLLLIDPQNDFHPGGSLAIADADKDAERISKLIKENLEKIDHIYVTLDSHQKYHIAHPLFWVNEQKVHPTPFTTVTKKDVENGKWKPTRAEHRIWGLHYVSELERKGNFALTIWPEHCLIGTPGHCVRGVIQEALQAWEDAKEKAVSYIVKGNNSKTEHYSAIKAEVIVPGEEDLTDLNRTLLDELSRHDKVLICGQASSHCVNFTVRDIADNWTDSSLKKLYVLRDAMSPVPGFEEAEMQFLKDMGKKGLVITSTERANLS
mmetsp:Transcript_9646/g.12517  ORF Transcript_9646/g.12517 Transcript_9646/m.12517 type:complete len:284 (-) Transcript_9646:399-1250(-)